MSVTQGRLPRKLVARRHNKKDNFDVRSNCVSMVMERYTHAEADPWRAHGPCYCFRVNISILPGYNYCRRHFLTVLKSKIYRPFVGYSSQHTDLSHLLDILSSLHISLSFSLLWALSAFRLDRTSYQLINNLHRRSLVIPVERRSTTNGNPDGTHGPPRIHFSDVVALTNGPTCYP